MLQNIEAIEEALKKLEKEMNDGFDRLGKRLDSLEEIMTDGKEEVQALLEKIENNLESK